MAASRFRWENSPNLEHHCGFCGRPLNHPGARLSCYGLHTEPCHRYHQSMFMRTRGHTCATCIGADEAHHKRHVDVAENLRAIYTLCGRPMLVSTGDQPDQQDADQDVDDDANADADSIADTNSVAGDAGEAPALTKRQRKAVKKLAKASRRPKVITSVEVEHIATVIHPAKPPTDTDAETPDNLDEICEIEKNLRYNAHVYNLGVKRKDLKNFDRLPDANVDFEAEMMRILDALDICQLQKQNEKNRGLQGKELRSFTELVADFKKIVVEDLLLVKKDEMETRMRRAGYMRYTSRTAVDIVEERYTDKDWKTGERIITPEATAPIKETSTLSCRSTAFVENTCPAESSKTPDKRHLTQNHRVLGQDGELREVFPTLTPARGMDQLQVSMKVLPPSLRIVGNYMTKPNEQPRAYIRRHVAVRQGSKGLFEAREDEEKLLTYPGPSPTSSFPPREEKKPVELLEFNICTRDMQTSKFPDSSRQLAVEIGGVESHPPVLQRKIKKSKRGTKRKAKKLLECAMNAEKSDIVFGSATEQDSGLPEDDFDRLGAVKLSEDPPRDQGGPAGDVKTHSTSQKEEITKSKEDVDINIFPRALPDSTAIRSTPPSSNVLASASADNPPIPVTTHGHHNYWRQYANQLILDQLSSPIVSSRQNCFHDDVDCLWCARSILDCPYHYPSCPCYDPLIDKCYLAFPHSEPQFLGPYTRLRAEKLLILFSKRKRFTNRLILIDDDMKGYLHADDLHLMPNRLSLQVQEYFYNGTILPLCRQEIAYRDLVAANACISAPITKDEMLQLQQTEFEPAGPAYFCYCKRSESSDPGQGYDEYVNCCHRHCPIKTFHRKCIENLGFEKVSAWYCTYCRKEMQLLAQDLLEDLQTEGILGIAIGQRKGYQFGSSFQGASVSNLGEQY